MFFTFANRAVLFPHLHIERVELEREKSGGKQGKLGAKNGPDEVKVRCFDTVNEGLKAVWARLLFWLARNCDHPGEGQDDVQREGDGEAQSPGFRQKVLHKCH